MLFRLLLTCSVLLLITGCGGGNGDEPRPPADANAPTETEARVIAHVWQAMAVEPYPVWVYRDTWTPDQHGRTWGDVGRASNVECPSKHGSELCAWGVWERGRIAVLQMTPETVDVYNISYRPPEPVERELFTLARLARLLIYERMHSLGWPYEMTDERRAAEAEYRAAIDWVWIDTLEGP